MRKIKLTKISDDKFEGNHPNGINTGFTITGIEVSPPTIGARFGVHHHKEYLGEEALLPAILTSTVLSTLDSNNEFKTLYSTYKLEYLD